MKRDYGLRLLKDGVARNVDLFFYDFTLFSITILGEGQYSTMVGKPHDGQCFALSMDFDRRQLEDIGRTRHALSGTTSSANSLLSLLLRVVSSSSKPQPTQR